MSESPGDDDPSRERFWTRRRLLGALAGGGLGAGGIWYANRRFLDTLPDNVIAPDEASGKFGNSLAVSDDGTTTIIGDPEKEEAYVFGQASGEWTQRAKFTTTDLWAEDIRIEGFGRSVAISADGTTALVGAPGDWGAIDERGEKVFVFTEEEGSWSRQATLTTPPEEHNLHLGESVALSGDGSLAIMSAPTSGPTPETEEGRVYVWSRAEGEWRLQTKLTAEDGEDRDFFGGAVALSRDGTTAIIGADGDDNHNGKFAGAAYVFTRTNDAWTQQAKLTSTSGTGFNHFGDRVAVSGDGTTALVGDSLHDFELTSCLVFERTETGWDRQVNFQMGGPKRASDFAVSDAGTRVVIPGDSATHVFDRTVGELWGRRSKLPPPNGVSNGGFRGTVAVSGDGTTAIINATQNGEGAVYSVELGDSDAPPQ